MTDNNTLSGALLHIQTLMQQRLYDDAEDAVDAALAAQPEVGGDWVLVPREVRDLYDFMVMAFSPFTSQQEQIAISLRKAKAAMKAAPTPAAVGGTGFTDRELLHLCLNVLRDDHPDCQLRSDVESHLAAAVGQGEDFPIRPPLTDDERPAAEQAYTTTAFDYEKAPVGSRDWTLYWKGWWHRAYHYKATPAAVREVDARQGVVIGYAQGLPNVLTEAEYQLLLTNGLGKDMKAVVLMDPAALARDGVEGGA